MQKWPKRCARWGRQGLTLVELIAVAVILGVIALIIVPNIVQSLHTSKSAALATTLATVQAASDQFEGVAGAYPTYPGTTVSNQPTTCPNAYEIQPTAQGLTGGAFAPQYLRTAPNPTAAWAGLPLAAGSQVYYGVTAGGLTFATQTPPTSGTEWTLGGTIVYSPTHANWADATTLSDLCQGQLKFPKNGSLNSSQTTTQFPQKR